MDLKARFEKMLHFAALKSVCRRRVLSDLFDGKEADCYSIEGAIPCDVCCPDAAEAMRRPRSPLLSGPAPINPVIVAPSPAGKQPPTTAAFQSQVGANECLDPITVQAEHVRSAPTRRREREDQTVADELRSQRSRIERVVVQQPAAPRETQKRLAFNKGGLVAVAAPRVDFFVDLGIERMTTGKNQQLAIPSALQAITMAGADIADILIMHLQPMDGLCIYCFFQGRKTIKNGHACIHWSGHCLRCHSSEHGLNDCRIKPRERCTDSSCFYCFLPRTIIGHPNWHPVNPADCVIKDTSFDTAMFLFEYCQPFIQKNFNDSNLESRQEFSKWLMQYNKVASMRNIGCLLYLYFKH